MVWWAKIGELWWRYKVVVADEMTCQRVNIVCVVNVVKGWRVWIVDLDKIFNNT